MNTKVTILRERVTPAGDIKVCLYEGKEEYYFLTLNNKVIVYSRYIGRVLRRYRKVTVKALVTN